MDAKPGSEWDGTEEPPEVAQAQAILKGPSRLPFCSGCNRQLQHEQQWRCPYVSCRKWLRSKYNPPPEHTKKGRKKK